ncbi:MAG: type II secretion system protein [Bacilli bacterium]|nr:type II secretion system protein [Bacilli bacterium]
MKKKGFTLIELLAVIVILAIISLIAVPVILNIIRDAKKSSAKDSAYGYIKAVENYQAMEMLKGNIGLKEGKYNTVSETTIGETKYKKLNDIVSLKGNKPTGGTVTILKNQTVGSAYLCINSYVVEYLNNEANIVSDDCGEMGSIIEFIVDSEDYQINRTLTINYPKGNYEYYYKVSGKAKLNDTYIEKDKEIKTENNVSILLEENQTVEVWMIKNGKKISLRNYVEEKIDNVEIGVPTVELQASIPILTKTGVQNKSILKVTYEKQEGTTPYYSIDDGKTWIKYLNETTINKSVVKVKLMRDSGRYGEIVEEIGTADSKYLSTDVYDNDLNTYYEVQRYDSDSNIVNLPSIEVSSEMQGKNFDFYVKTDATTGTVWPAYYDKDDNLISYTKINYDKYDGEITDTIPLNTSKIRFFKRDTYTAGYVCEVGPSYKATIDIDITAPKLTESGVKDASATININYSEESNVKLYRINDGEWQKYTGAIKTSSGSTIYAKSTVNDIDKDFIVEQKVVFPENIIKKDAYDNDKETYISLPRYDSSTYVYREPYIEVSNEMWGKQYTIYSKTLGTAGRTWPFYYDKDDKLISYEDLGTGQFDQELHGTIPENTVRIRFAKISTDTSSYIYEIYPKK